jgi:transposase-like protein
MKKSRKTYDRDFKLKAVMLSYEKGNVTEIAKDLQIHRDNLFLWRRDCRKYGTGSFPGQRNLRLNSKEQKVYDLERKIKETNLKFEILRNASKYICLGKPYIFYFIAENEKNYSLRLMYKTLGVGGVTYRMWKKGFVSERQKEKMTLKKEIISIFAASKETYGSFRITAELQKKYFISRTPVVKCMRELGLYVSCKKNNSAILKQRTIPNGDS